jgi:hypothetical protein
LTRASPTRDQWHDRAQTAFERLREERVAVITTTFVLAECGNATSRTSARSEVIRFGAAMEAGGALITPSDSEWHEAWTRYASGHIGGPGLVDEISFAVMRRLGLRQAFTNDRHFLDSGFEPLF